MSGQAEPSVEAISPRSTSAIPPQEGPSPLARKPNSDEHRGCCASSCELMKGSGCGRRLCRLPSSGTVLEKFSSATVSISIPIAWVCILVSVYTLVFDFDPRGTAPIASILPYPNSEAGTAAEVFWQSLLNASTILAPIVGVTFLVAAMMAFQFAKATFLLVLALHIAVFISFALFLLDEVVHMGGVVDFVTALVIWCQLVGVPTLGIFWVKSGVPQLGFQLQQNCIVYACAALAWPIVSLPEWTLWLFLVELVLWDLIAVLTPCGPLQCLMRAEKKRQSSGKGLALPPGLMIYGSGFSLGSGDLLFYAVMVGRSATAGIAELVAVITSVLAGLSITVVATFRSNRVAIPALPFVIVFSIISYFAVRYAASDIIFHLSAGGMLLI